MIEVTVVTVATIVIVETVVTVVTVVDKIFFFTKQIKKKNIKKIP